MTFPAEHAGTVKKRMWYKVKWVSNPPGMRIEGMFDLLMDAAVDTYRPYLRVIETVETRQCDAGLPVGFGKTEAAVDDWIRKNRTPRSFRER